MAQKKAQASRKSAKSARSRSGSSELPCVLAIGGLDPGGGAGVLADSRAIARAEAFACAAIALMTVQSTSGLRSATPTPTRDLIAQCTEVLKTQDVRAIKIGALGNDENARAVGDLLAIHRDIPSVIDTVMLPTRGHGRLLEERAVTVLRDRVIKRATLVTVNAPEAEVLTGLRVTRLDEARDAAIAILALGPHAVLLKGGHLSGAKAIDLLVVHAEDDEPTVIELASPRLKLPPTHGGGCVLASLIAGAVANGKELVDGVRWAKRIHHAALGTTSKVGGAMRVLLA